MSSKALRVTTACDACRNKRVKCDGTHPVCSPCAAANIGCTYSQKTRKRGLPTGYIHSLELQVVVLRALLGRLLSLPSPNLLPQLSSLLSESSDLNSTLRPALEAWDNSPAPQMLAAFASANKNAISAVKTRFDLGLEPAKRNGESPSVQSDEVNDSLKCSSQTGLSAEPVGLDIGRSKAEPSSKVATGLSSGFVSINVGGDSICSYDVLAEESGVANSRERITVSGFSRETLRKYVASPHSHDPFRVSTIFELSSAAMGHISATDKIVSEPLQTKAPLSLFQFPPGFRQSIDAHFHNLQTLIPMLDRSHTLRLGARVQERPAPDPSLQMSEVALLWAILALETAPETGPAQQYAQNSLSALEMAPTVTIESIQAMLLLGLHFYNCGSWEKSWVLAANCARMALDLRLMQPVTKDRAHSNPCARERTWAAVCVVDTLLAARLGRAPVVNAADWPVPRIPDDGWEEWDFQTFGETVSSRTMPGRCLSIYNQLLGIVAILNTALTCNMSSSNVSINEAGRFELYKSELESWKAGLPPHCQLSLASSPLVVFLHLCSNSVVCVSATRFENTVQAMEPSTRLELMEACVSTREILDLGSSTSAREYPFIDYFVLMPLNFMGKLESETESNTRRFMEFLQSGKKHIPFQITWELYQLEHENEGTTRAGPVAEEAPTLKEKAPFDPSVFHFFNNSHFSATPKFDLGGRQRFSAFSQNAPKDELDLFMLDTDFAKSDGRRDTFMRNLGIINTQTIMNDPGSNIF